MLSKINKARKEMEKVNGSVPSVSEIAAQLDMHPDKIRLYADSSRNVLSLEGPVNGGGGGNIAKLNRSYRY